MGRLSIEIIHKIQEEVLSGRSRYKVAYELGVSPVTVYRYTRDISPSNKEPTIKGKTLDLLVQLLSDGYIFSTVDGKRYINNLRELQRIFPVIKAAHCDNKTIFYLEDKNRVALKALIKNSKSRLINYYDLAGFSKALGVDLLSSEKKKLFGKKDYNSCPKIRLKEGGNSSSFFGSQQKLTIEFEYKSFNRKKE